MQSTRRPLALFKTAGLTKLFRLQHQQEEAAEHSALINRAYATLKSPLERAKYVVKPASLHSFVWTQT